MKQYNPNGVFIVQNSLDGLSRKKQTMKEHRKINLGTVGVVLSLVHDALNAGQFIWLLLQHLI